MDRRQERIAVRVAHLTGSISRLAGGPYDSVRRLTQELTRQGCGVSVAAIRDARTQADLPTWLPLHPDVFDAIPPRSLGCSPSWRRHLERERPQLVHVHGLWMAHGFAGTRWAQREGRPYVISPRGMLEPWALKHRGWKKQVMLWAWQRTALEGAACLHATCEAEAEQFRKLGLKNRIAVIPNGVDLPETPVREQDGAGQRLAVFLSRMHPIKGLPKLLRAWKAVRPSGWRLVIAGPDECGHTADLKRLTVSLGLQRQVEFLGPLYGDAKWRLLSQAELFVLPTNSENFGLAVAEALACGVPVITTTGAPWSLLVEERCGWWVAPQDGAIAEALKEATLSSSERLGGMGARGRAAVASRLAWGKIAKQMVDLYQGLTRAELGWAGGGGE